MTWLTILKVTLVLGLARAALPLMRRQSAATRHLVVVLAFSAALLIPSLEAIVPEWQVLPASAAVSTPLAGNAVSAGASGQRPGAGLEEASPVPGLAGSARVKSGAIEQVWRALPAIWLAGAVALLIVLMLRAASMAYAAQRARPLTAPAWTELVEEARSGLGVRTPVRIRMRPGGVMPAVWGWRRPVLLLPSDCDSWSEDRRRDVVLHEMAHIRRRDVALLALSHLACALHWFNPLAWSLKHRLVMECEHASDDLALISGAKAPSYANHLLATAVGYHKQHSLAPVMAARSQLEGRIMAILDQQRNRQPTARGVQVAIALVAAVMLVPLSSISLARGEQDSVHVHEHENLHVDVKVHINYDSDSDQFAAHLREMGIDRSDIDALLAGLESPDAITRGASAWALGDSDEARVVDPLIQAGYDEDPVVRQWAVRSLSNWQEPRVGEMLVARLQDSDSETRQWAVRTLKRHNDKLKTEPLMNTLADGDAEVREWAVRVLSDVDSPQVRATFARALQAESDPAVTEWLVRGLGGADDLQSRQALMSALYSESTDVREWAVRGLGGTREAAVVNALIGMLGDDSADVREWSARGLAVCGNEAAVGPLQAMTQDPSQDVREWVEHALEKISC